MGEIQCHTHSSPPTKRGEGLGNGSGDMEFLCHLTNTARKLKTDGDGEQWGVGGGRDLGKGDHEQTSPCSCHHFFDASAPPGMANASYFYAFNYLAPLLVLPKLRQMPVALLLALYSHVVRMFSLCKHGYPNCRPETSSQVNGHL